jgi:hypothetical protein
MRMPQQVAIYQKYAPLRTGRVCESLVPLDGYDTSDSPSLLRSTP